MQHTGASEMFYSPHESTLGQTYTYFIKTVREEASDVESVTATTDGILVGKDASGGTTMLGASKAFDEPASQARGSSINSQAVHGYEVRKEVLGWGVRWLVWRGARRAARGGPLL